MTSAFDIAVAGAGPAGLAAACLLAKGGARVALIAGAAQADADPRTVALMLPSIRLLEYLGLWPGVLKGKTVPLRRLRLIDDTGSAIAAPPVTFDASEIGLDAFGWNVPLALLVPALLQLAATIGVTHIAGMATGLAITEPSVDIRLSGGEAIAARAVIAADGRTSKLRTAAGIAAKEWTYEQSAIATSFGHSVPHRDVSTEYHKAAGPFTTVPLPGKRSSLVWMERPDRAEQLMNMAEKDFAAEIQAAAHGELGMIEDIGPRKSFAMRGLTAEHFAARRVFLVGEAGHAGPPIGAQGLNMSLRDAALAAELIIAADDPGAEKIVELYHARRRADVLPRQTAIDLMNRSLLTGFLPLEAGRALGLSVLDWAGPVRRFAMRRGLGPAYGLPQAMQG